MTDPEQPARRRPLILASTSKYRAELLGRLGLPFVIQSPGVDEHEIPGESPRDRAHRLAREKAQAVATRFPDAIVIGSDQVAAANATLLRKPGNANNCRQQLKLLAGSGAEFYTGCAVRSVNGRIDLAYTDTTAVKVRNLSDAEIDRYIDREQPFDCAGGFKAEGLGIALFERIDSDDPTALIGLPLIWLAAALRHTGFEVP